MNRKMDRIWYCSSPALAIIAALLLAGCAAPQNASVRSVNASPGLKGYGLQVGLSMIAASLPYGTEGVTQYGPIDSSGNYRLIGSGANESIVVSTSTATLTTQTATLLQNNFYTFVTVDAASAPGILMLTDDDSAPQGSNFKWRLVDTSLLAGPVDIYLTAPGASLNGATPAVSNLAYGQTSPYLELTPGNDVIQVTQHGNTASALFKAAFSPAASNIYTTFFLDPPLDPPSGGTGTYSLLTTDDPVSASAPSTPPAKP